MIATVGKTPLPCVISATRSTPTSASCLPRYHLTGHGPGVIARADTTKIDLVRDAPLRRTPSRNVLGDRPAGHWSALLDDLGLEGLVCPALPGRTVMGEPAAYLSHTNGREGLCWSILEPEVPAGGFRAPGNWGEPGVSLHGTGTGLMIMGLSRVQ